MILVKGLFVSILMLLTSACGTISYYSHLANGHHALMEAEEDIEDILNKKKYKETVRVKLKKALEIRQFATKHLGMPDNDSYKTFVQLDRPYPVWNVIAAKKFSVSAKQWCFLIVGCISYRGYFNEQDAINKAKELEQEGYDVAVSPAAAYSTLGWFDDPLLSSMLYKDDMHLAGIIFHELAHQKVYIDDDSSFNEAFATAVELEGVRRWLEANGDTKGMQRYTAYKKRQVEFNALLRTTRLKLKGTYKLSNATDSDRLKGKQKIITDMKKDYQRLKKSWGGYSGYDKWMARDINNAHLSLVATYHELVPAFTKLLEQQAFQLEKFYEQIEKLGDLPKSERLTVLGK